MDSVDDAYDRAVEAMRQLRNAWSDESHSTKEGQAAIGAAIKAYNEAARALVAEWNNATERVSPPILSPLDEPAPFPPTSEPSDEGGLGQAIPGPGDS